MIKDTDYIFNMIWFIGIGLFAGFGIGTLLCILMS